MHQMLFYHQKLPSALLFIFLLSSGLLPAQKKSVIDISGFHDSQHHWKDITDHDQIIVPLNNQKSYKPKDIRGIADNILLYQQPNGGWPKNYDMLAILTKKQKDALLEHTDSDRTTFDNGATYSQVEYLAKAYSATGTPEYKIAALKGIRFMLRAQYSNGGWPQFYPDRSGYRKYITFNDGAMIGVMTVLHHIVGKDPDYLFIDESTRQKAAIAFANGIDCILKCQIKENGRLTVWCQQHDQNDFHPVGARTFELASKSGEESAEIVQFLMSMEPTPAIRDAVINAIRWFNKVEIKGIRIKTIPAAAEVYRFHATNQDKIVVQDSAAPPLWARYYELNTDKPFFANRDGKEVYTLAEVSRERRTGYGWYGYWPANLLNVQYQKWLNKIR